MNKICFFITLVFTVISQLISLTFAEEYRFRLVEPSEVRAIGFNRELPPEYDPTGRIDPFQPRKSEPLIWIKFPARAQFRAQS